MRPLPLTTFLIATACCLGTNLARADAPAAPPGPLPFTGHLLEVPGVQGILSLRHPKLIGQDLEKMMTAVPETAGMRMMLLRAAAFGYPEFSDIAPGSNVGLAMLADSDASPDPAPVWVGMAQLKPGGSISTLLVSMGLKTKTHGKWTLFAQSGQALARLSDPDSLAAYLDAPQANDLKVWLRTSPRLLSHFKDKFRTAMATAPAAGPVPSKKVMMDYMSVVFSVLEQLHSVEGSWNFGDRSIGFHYAFQFRPDTPLGTALRYPQSGTAPAEIPLFAHAAGTLVQRMNPQAMQVAATWFVHALPPGAAAAGGKPWTETFQNYLQIWRQNADGGVAGAFDLPAPAPKPKPGRPPFTMVMVQSGHWTPESAHRMGVAAADFTSALLKGIGGIMPSPGSGNPLGLSVSTSLHDHAFTTEGVSFDDLESKWTVAGVVNSQSQYFGAIHGFLVTGNTEAGLRERVPAIVAGHPSTDSSKWLGQQDRFLRMELDGGRTVEELFPVLGLDSSNPDIRAEMNQLRAGYDADGPMSLTGSIGQARFATTFTLPYGFLESTFRLFIYLNAKKVDWTRLVPVPRIPPTRTIRPSHNTGQTL